MLKKFCTLVLLLTTIAVMVPFTQSEAQGPFNEAPMLSDQVAAGELPPVEERLPADPPVTEVVEEIGQYGGTLHLGTPDPGGYRDGWWVVSAEGLLRVGPAASSVYPNLAYDWELSEDGTSLTMYLLEGVKWSDGMPFTTDDILFWYEDVLQNEGLTPGIAPTWKPGGELFELTIIDDYTFQMDFAAPAPDMIPALSHLDGGFPVRYPRHYLKDYHVDYADPDELAAKVEDAGFETWVELFNYVTSESMLIPRVPGLPVLYAHVLVEATPDRYVFERNPYYWRVDAEGNQLPYIDGFDVVLVNSAETMTARTVTGEFDLASHTTALTNYSLYQENAEEGNYSVYLWPRATSWSVVVNLTSEDPVLRDLFNTLDFRRALSVAINRDEVNNVVYFGLGKAEQHSVVPGSAYFQEDLITLNAEYDPDLANSLLDGLGLTERDSEGYRLGPDGNRIQWTLEAPDLSPEYAPIAELLLDYWREIGLDVRFDLLSFDLVNERWPANKADMGLRGFSGLTDFQFSTGSPCVWAPVRASDANCMGWSLWAQWYTSGGEIGEEPPDDVKELLDKWEQLLATIDLEERAEIGQWIVRNTVENVTVMSAVMFPPRPLIVSDRLHNVPEDGLWGWDPFLMYAFHPEQFYIAE